MTKPFPPEALAQHLAILGKTGSGKTVTSKGFVEQWLKEGRHVGIVDPTSAWWGLRSSRDGKGPGFPILLLGGDHGDLPLPALGGAAVARLLAEQGVSLIADTSLLTVGERTRWFIDFGSTLHRLNRSPLHLVIDEAHMFAPQGKVPDPDTGKMLHAANTIASGGRSRGIRLTMITQRPAKLHKDTLTCADTLIAMRMLAPQDREAVEDWIKGCGDIAAGKQVLNTLASLQRGEGWAWYPEGQFLERLKFPANSTFDSSATPTDGHTRAAPKGMADIDLTEIRAALADAVKEAEANDPRLLRQEIARLKAEAGKPRELAVDVAALEREYQRGRADGNVEAVDALMENLNRLDSAGKAIANATLLLESFSEDLRVWRGSRPGPKAPMPSKEWQRSLARPDIGASKPRETVQAVKHPRQLAGNGSAGNSGPITTLQPGERTILTALAQYEQGCTREQLSILAGYKKSSRDAYIARLIGKGLAESWQDGRVRATSEGVQALGPDFQPLPVGEDLQAYWLARLPPGEALILQSLIDAYPREVTRDGLSQSTEYKKSSRDAYIARLRARQLIQITGRGELRAAEELF